MTTRAIILKVSLIAIFLLSVHGVRAEEATKLIATPVPDRVAGALKDLSLAVGHTITTTKEARAICNQDQYLTICAEIGKKHKLYSAERAKEVDVVLEQLKGKIMEQLKACTTSECLLNVANALSKKLTSHPATAEKLNLTTKKIEEHKATVEKAKKAETDIAQKQADFKAALASGAITCGDNTVEGCTKFCMKTSVISPLCRDIAQKYFGPGVLQRLEQAHQQRSRPKPQPQVVPQIQKPASNSPGLIFSLFDTLLR